jgi:lysine decarboxylase
MTPREAFLGDIGRVPIAEAEGRICAETIAGYPPGIPALLPGERITREAIDYLRELVAAGARLHGASDPELESIFVVAE